MLCNSFIDFARYTGQNRDINTSLLVARLPPASVGGFFFALDTRQADSNASISASSELRHALLSRNRSAPRLR